ncbi:MAG: hypothetical protein WBE13_13825 [Candidatus Acidiferrum sp.]
MHWIDAAEDRDVSRATAKADLMDALRPRWLFDRRSIQRKEVASTFFLYLGVPSDGPQMTGDISEVILDLVGQHADRGSRAFVSHFRRIGEKHPLNQSLRRALETNRKNILLRRARKFTPEVARKVERLYVQSLLPDRTPAGLVIDNTSRNQFLDHYQINDFPSIALEDRATRDNWRRKRELNRNNFIDQQHLMALPFVSFFLSDDHKLRAQAARIVEGLPFPVGQMLTKTEFDAPYAKS